MIENRVLKEAVDFAFDEMPESSMSPEEAARQKRLMLDKIASGEIKTPEDVMTAFDELNKGE